MMKTTKLYIFISVWMTLTFIQSHSCIRNQNFSVHFLANISVDLNEIQSIDTTIWFVETQFRSILHE